VKFRKKKEAIINKSTRIKENRLKADQNINDDSLILEEKLPNETEKNKSSLVDSGAKGTRRFAKTE